MPARRSRPALAELTITALPVRFRLTRILAALLLLAAAAAIAAPARAQPASASAPTAPAPAAPATPSGRDRVLVIGTKEAPPFSMKDESGNWTGISIELWRRIAQRLQLHYRFQETTLPGLVDETAAGTLDAAVAALTVTTEREQAVDFTQPFTATGLGIAVSRNAKFDWFRLLDSFLSVGFLEAMLGLVGVTILVGVLVWVFERRHSEQFAGMRKGLVTSVWWSALTMTQAGAEQEPASLPGRLIAVAWMGASVLAIAVFTAGITSQMTARQLQGVVHGVDDLPGARVGAVSGTASLPYLTQHHIRYRSFPDAPTGLAALAAGRIDAFVYDKPLLAWYAHEKFADSVDILDAVFDKQTYAIALPSGSPLRMPINLALLDLISSPWWEELNQKYLGRE